MPWVGSTVTTLYHDRLGVLLESHPAKSGTSARCGRSGRDLRAAWCGLIRFRCSVAGRPSCTFRRGIPDGWWNGATWSGRVFPLRSASCCSRCGPMATMEGRSPGCDRACGGWRCVGHSFRLERGGRRTSICNRTRRTANHGSCHGDLLSQSTAGKGVVHRA